MEPVTESAVGLAFLMGVASAVSLPLGALTAMRFRFTDRVISFLMAFGGGALLAALTLDLVAAGIDRGHFVPLGVGWVIGGALFMLLNNAVNDIGGFKRKVSTTIYQLRRQERRRFRRFLSGMRSLDIFADLPARDYEALRASIQHQHYPRGAHLFHKGDPGDFLYLIESGEVDLINPEAPKKARAADATRRDVIGRIAFLTGCPSALNAVALTDCRVLKLPKSAFMHLLANSPELAQAVHRWLRSEEVFRYLVTLQGMAEPAVEAWVSEAGRSLYSTGRVPDAIEVPRAREHFLALSGNIGRFELFAELPLTEREALADFLIHKVHPKGHRFFFDGEQADRMYFLDRGDVALYDPRHINREPDYLTQGDPFGVLAFVTGARHSTTAVATSDVSVWVLRRSDFSALMARAPSLRQRLHEFLGSPGLEHYLVSQQRLSTANALKWSRLTRSHLDEGRPLPSASAFGMELPDQHGAPLAIWLGILLDGIPEGLVIGAGLVGDHLSLSLLAGLFISNYPEALSSSSGMREEGFSPARIYLMWGSLVVLTGLLAAVGNLFFVAASPLMLTLIQAIAAGAMLTMIAQTMLPEAYFRGGAIVPPDRDKCQFCGREV